MLVFWSADYANSEICMEEFRLGWQYARRKSHRVGQRLWIVNPESGVGHIHAGDLSSQNYLGLPTAETGADWARMIAAKVVELELTGRLAEGAGGPSLSVLHGLPAALEIVGRGKERLQIHGAAFPAEISRAAVSPLVQLCGMPGIGKSALAVDYAYTYADDYPGGVWWFDMGSTRAEFDTPEALLHIWLDAARHTLHLDPTGLAAHVMQSEAGRELTAIDVRNRLLSLLDKNGGAALWVLNDFPLVRRVEVRNRALEILRLPLRRGLTIITSRDARSMPAATILTLPELPAIQAAYLLASHLPHALRQDEASVISALASAVGGHPLALSLLGEYASAEAVPLARIHRQVAERGALQRLEEIHSLLQPDLGDSARSIIAAFEMSTRPFRADSHARWLLALICACAAGKPIPVELLGAAFGGDDREDDFHRVLSALQRASLLDRPSATVRQVAMHPLVAQVAVRIMDLNEPGASAAVAAALLQRMSRLDQSAGAFVELLPCVAHAEKLRGGLGSAEAVRLSTGLSRLLAAAGRLAAALGAAQDAVELSQASMPAGSRDALNARVALSCAVAQHGDLVRAAVMQSELLHDARESLGEQDDDTLSICSHLADTLAQQHRFDLAEALQRELVATLTSLHGPEHGDVVSARSALAGVLYQRGHYPEAVALQRLVRSAVEQLHGVATADYLIATSNQAITELALGHVEDAIRLHAQALQIGQGVLGHAHPVLRACMTSLADSFVAANQMDMALALYERVHDVTAAVLGERHPESILLLSRVLAARVSCQSNPNLADLAVFVAAADSTLAAGHPLLQQAVEHLIDALHAQSLPLSPLLGLMQEVLEIRTRDLGESDVETLSAASNLSIALGELGRWHEAVELRRRVLDGTVKSFGPYNPQAIQKMAELAEALQQAGETDESAELLEMAENSVARYLRSKVGH